MNIVITLAGHSRRFKAFGYDIPKFLIEIDGIPIISYVVDMFGSEDKFHFVINNEQEDQYPQINNILKSLAKKTEIHIINPHEKGPVYSAMQIDSIKDEEEVIISYCDFIVNWNYKKFLKEVSGFDGAVPSFKGFHPASFGHTYYAYMRINEKNEMLELSEKNSFTDTRHEEPASTGIYYFRKWKIFKKYADKIMKDGFENLKEGYVSLLFNPMVCDNLKVLVNYVDKFICFGTPEDLEQYLFWSKYFQYKKNKNLLKKNYKQINLIPMAGRGSRFKNFGYRISKPLIQIQNKPMVVNACNSFPASDNWIFLIRGDDLKKFPIRKTLDENFTNCKIVPVVHETSGQLATCLLARDEVNKDFSLFIASADYETVFRQDKWQEILNEKDIDVVVWTCSVRSNLFKNPKAFAYCKTKPKTSIVTDIVEKDIISNDPGSDPLVVGSFWFRKANDFFEMADEVIDKDIKINNEHYVGNGINLMIKKGKKVIIFDIDQWISYGDPFELDIYYYWEEFFLEKMNNNLSNITNAKKYIPKNRSSMNYEGDTKISMIR